MKWPLKPKPIPRSDTPYFNLQYVNACSALADSTIVWGSEFPAAGLQSFLREINRESPVMITSSHVLIAATGRALARHPHLNRRVVGRRVYEFNQINVRLSLYCKQRQDVEVNVVANADQKTLDDIATEVWRTYFEATQWTSAVSRDKQWQRKLPAWLYRGLTRMVLGLDRRMNLPIVSRTGRLRSASVLVNDLSFRGAPPMTAYKPSSFPDESLVLNVTLGPCQEKPGVVNGTIAPQSVFPLYVRADHRIADAFQLGQFVATLRNTLMQPDQLAKAVETPQSAAA